MAIIAGIDEAGYGPVLGPLVITVAAFDVPDEKAGCSLWELLKDAVSTDLKNRRQRLCVRDSKKIYHANTGLKPLEESVLSFLQVKDLKTATSFYQLLGSLSCYNTQTIARYPWYADKDYSLPAAASVATIVNYSSLLQYAMDKYRVRFYHASSCVVPVREFNEQVRLAGNKSVVLFNNCATLVSRLWELSRGTIHLIIDKQGGRNSYLGLLRGLLPNASLRVLEEGAKVSTYEAVDTQRKMTISFVEKGEDVSMAAALASMFSKYVRELFMRLENQYWLQCVPGLRPTAGYYEDAQRFLSEIAPVMKERAIQDDLLIRIK